QSVDEQLHDAAAVDGASPTQRFRHVTLPGIWPVLRFLTLIGFVGALQLFELPYILYQGNGPGLRAITIVGYLYAWGFEINILSYAATIGWVLAIIIAIVSAIYLRLSRSDR
ncbi:MAG TPA: sugar ABC transporter permease, partial [Tepidisphaeraceae bacterium]|nr:sugar ABC transporter permease [Tepidisphaeraceae bacterium]